MTRDGGRNGEVLSGAVVGRQPLSGAERQRRFRERRKLAMARAGPGGTVADWQRPPFEAGNFAAVKSGSQSERLLVPRAEQILAEQRADPSWPEYLDRPVFAASVMAWARSEAAVQLFTEYISAMAPEAWVTEVTSGEEEVAGDGARGGGGSSSRTSRTRKVGASLEQWRKLETLASGLRSKLGLDPLARARLGRDFAAGQVDLAALMAQLSAEESAASQR